MQDMDLGGTQLSPSLCACVRSHECVVLDFIALSIWAEFSCDCRNAHFLKTQIDSGLTF